jgi:hypothetical protein
MHEIGASIIIAAFSFYSIFIFTLDAISFPTIAFFK